MRALSMVAAARDALMTVVLVAALWCLVLSRKHRDTDAGGSDGWAPS